jgi:dihydroorotase
MEIVRNSEGLPIKIRMFKPSDMHQHFRDDWRLPIVAPLVAERFQIAVAMPNLSTPITTIKQMERHFEAINEHFGRGRPSCDVLVTLYLTDTLETKEVEKAADIDNFAGIKYYPKGLTTGSDKGVTDPLSLWTAGTKPYRALRVLQDTGKVLLMHGADGVDKNGHELDPYDQEKHFIKESLPRIRDAHPNLKISLEHISTMEACDYIENNASPWLGASITPHHLLLDRRDVFRGGFRPHRSWMPVIQPEEHKEAIRDFIKRGRNFEFIWLGSDSAPHPQESKESDCCASGVMTAHAAIELYAEAFEDMGILDKLEQFASINGPRFFGATPHEENMRLVREEWVVKEPFIAYVPPSEKASGVERVIPFRLGEKMRWKLVR